MKRLLILVMLVLMVVPAMADVDTFAIKTLYSPTQYLIDYGETSTAIINNYSIESSTDLVANQTWILLASNSHSTIETLDNRYNISFTAGLPQNFTITIPNNYRFYHLVFNDGFYDPSTVLTLNLYSTTNKTPITTPAPKIIRTTETNYLPIILLGIVIVILFIMFMWKRRY